MTESIIKEYYTEVNALWKNGLNPTLKLNIISVNSKLPNLYYTNFNITDFNRNVNAIFEVTYSLDGKVEDGNAGNLDVLELTSEGYTSEFFFDECAYYLNNLVDQFIKKNGIANYQSTIEIYADVLEKEQIKAEVKVKANADTGTTSNKTKQKKVKGNTTTTTTTCSIEYTGGTLTSVTSLGTVATSTDPATYYLFTFTDTSSTANNSIKFTNVSGNIPLSLLAIGGGGQSVTPQGDTGGAGAGGFINQSLTVSTDGGIDITVGVAGPSETSYNGGSTILKSKDSQFATITAYGGSSPLTTNPPPTSEIGSGCGVNGSGTTSGQTTTTSGQGNNGGGYGCTGGSGGGGGAGGSGAIPTAVSDTCQGGNGGIGAMPSSAFPGITGINTTYYAGGCGGFGAGNSQYGNPGAGSDNYGGTQIGGSGNVQPGVVMIAVPIDAVTDTPSSG